MPNRDELFHDLVIVINPNRASNEFPMGQSHSYVILRIPKKQHACQNLQIMKTIIPEEIISFDAELRNLVKRASSPRAWLLIPLLVACFGLCQQAHAQDTPDPGGVGGSFNTADGTKALGSVTTGIANSAFGWFSLSSNTDGAYNTAVGGGTLLLHVGDQTTQEGIGNTAVGAAALLFNTTGFFNVAVGALALRGNSTGGSGFFNNAVGAAALDDNVVGSFNNAHGRGALQASDGDENNAFGDATLFNNVSGSANTAVGDDALVQCIDGSSNVAIGDEAGTAVVHGSNIICIGAGVTGGGGPFEDLGDTCFIGNIFGEPVSDPGTQTAVFVDTFNVVGVFNSSRKYKHDIQPMDKASEELYRLKPVTFKFNSDWKGTTQYGLIAEEVAEVDPQLVVRKDGELVTVRYEQVNSMLLNEFLKEHRKVQELEKQVEKLAAGLQKVSAQLEASKPAPQVVTNAR